MIPTTRVLDPEPVPDLAAYEAAGGGTGLRAAVEGGADAALAVVEASGLRGRGGAGFPTATKWRSVLETRPADQPLPVVVNAAEGEPGSFKDRAILRTNPYRVLEGALVAAVTVGADRVVVATKASFEREVARLREAAAAITTAGWTTIPMEVVEGPAEYLYGEETALLEVVAGRLPFPRIAPPWRVGLAEGDAAPAAAPGTEEPPASAALVNNVETMAHVATILANGPEWFREVGTADSPGTIVCTVSGPNRGAGVVEVPMGTPLREVVEAVGHPVRPRPVVGVLSGVSNRFLPATSLDTPLTYEAMAAAGSGLGTGGFIVFDDTVDPVAVAEGVSRFLAVESCGQCTPCKQDGLAIASSLEQLRRGGAANDEQVVEIRDRLTTIDRGARCYLATQHQQVVDSFLELFPDAFGARVASGGEPVEPYLVAELVDLVPGPGGLVAMVDERHRDKQPDWTFDAETSGQSPADRFDQRLGDAAV